MNNNFLKKYYLIFKHSFGVKKRNKDLLKTLDSFMLSLYSPDKILKELQLNNEHLLILAELANALDGWQKLNLSQQLSFQKLIYLNICGLIYLKYNKLSLSDSGRYLLLLCAPIIKAHKN